MNAALSESERNALAGASYALWLATLSLMTAFMQNPAPAHRYLLARRISGNFDTLRQQDCFATVNRQAFERLALRWQQQAQHLAPARRPGSQGFLGLLSDLSTGANRKRSL
ncbi:MAG: hypothetical protein EON92_07080 [Burkholderiales bacterium]|nr:MAG: hypothetical protein EON92_07080 [Burkholderiales bacterium]